MPDTYQLLVPTAVSVYCSRKPPTPAGVKPVLSFKRFLKVWNREIRTFEEAPDLKSENDSAAELPRFAYLPTSLQLELMIAGMKGNFSLAVVCWSVGANYELLSPTK